MKTAATSISSRNPWIFYEAGIICPWSPDGNVRRNSSEEKVINLREWDKLTRPQRIALRRQDIARDEWERLPWTGHVCFLFTRASEIGRSKSHYKRTKEHNEMTQVLDDVKNSHANWMRGAEEPLNWDQRFSIDKQQWPERWHTYERNLALQQDMEFWSEAVFSL